MASTAIAHLLFSYDGGASAWCFEVLQEGYQGDDRIYARDVSYNINGQLLVVEASENRREFKGNVLIRFSVPGETYDYAGATYTVGDYDALRTCLVQEDLQVRSPFDKALWDAQWVNDWRPRLVYDSKGEYRVVNIHLVERT